MSALSSGLSGGGLVAGAAPGGGQGGFGFQIPQGNAGELDAAAGACSKEASLLSSRGRDVLAGLRIASGGWEGQAEQAFVSYSSHVVSVFEANSAAFGAAARTLSAFSRELEAAQRVTTQALRECEKFHQEMTSQNQAAAAHAQNASTLTQQAAAAPHPQIQGELQRQAGIAQGQAADANRAAAAARGQFEAAQQRGIQAWQRYEHEAQATARAVGSAAEAIQMVQRLPGGAAPLLAGAGGGVSLAGGMPILAATLSPFTPLLGLENTAVNAVGGANTAATAAVLPFTARAGYQLVAGLQARSSNVAGLPERFGQTVGPLAQMYDHGEVPLSAVAAKSQSFMASEAAKARYLSADVAKSRGLFAAGGISSRLAAPLGALAIGGDALTVADSHASTSDRVVSGMNAAATAATFVPEGATIVGINAATDWIPVGGEVVAVGSGVYLGGEWLYQNWTPFHDVVSGAGQVITHDVPHVITHDVPHFVTHDVPDALGTAAHYAEPWNWFG